MASSSAVTPSGSTASDQVDRLASLLLQHTNTFLISQTQSILGPLGALEEVPNDTLDPARQRRIHRKSRAGCMNCRKRRVKCDEKEHRCSNCSRRREICEYRSKSTTYSSPTNAGSTSPPSPVSLLPLRHTAFMGSDAPVNLLHMKLFHHFQTCTQHTLVFGAEIWEQAIKLSLEFQSLMQAILCIAARHMAFLFPEESKYGTAAAIHLSQTLHLFREDLSSRFSPANVDAFMTTALLLHHEIWSNTDFISIGSDGNATFDPARDHLFELSTGMQQIFTNSIPHLPVRPSLFIQQMQHSPRVVLSKVAQVSRRTFDHFTSYFAYDRPLDKQLLQVPQPFVRDADLSVYDALFFNPGSPTCSDSSAPESFARSISRLCLMMSFLPEVQGAGSTGLTSDLVPDFARYVFSFPVMCERPVVQMMNESNHMALLLLYHFYRTIRIMLPVREYWWAQKRANIAEVVLKSYLEEECSRSIDAIDRNT